MTTREACGNSVRNITACAYAGVSATRAVRRDAVLRDDDAVLPAPSAQLVAAAQVQDWLRRLRGRPRQGRHQRHRLARPRRERPPRVPRPRGRRHRDDVGQRPRCSTTSCRSRRCSTSPRRSCACSTALGDYKHKHKNRMKFLMKSLGWDKWRAEFERALAEVQAEGGVPLPFDPATLPVEQAPSARSAAAVGRGHRRARVARGTTAWPGDSSLEPLPVGRDARRRTCVGPPRTCGTRSRPATSRPSSPCRSATSRASSSACWRTCRWPTATARCAMTPTQNLVFRWVKRDDAQALYARLAAAGLGLGDADTIADITSCPGAESCKLAVTQSRGLGQVPHGLRARESRA